MVTISRHSKPRSHFVHQLGTRDEPVMEHVLLLMKLVEISECMLRSHVTGSQLLHSDQGVSRDNPLFGGL